MLLSSEIRKNIRNGVISPGTWLQLSSPDVAEIMARMGYDWVVVDLENGALSRVSLPDMFRAIECGGALPIARPASASCENIRAALDCGARGLILPKIETRAQLDAAIQAAMYPGGREFSAGTRGVCLARANGYGLELVEHFDPESGLGRDIVIVAEIEHINAMKEIDEILAHPRLDAYMVCRYDFSASMGMIGDFSNPEFLAVQESIRTKAAAHRVPAGFHVLSPNQDELAQRAREGYTFLAYGMDAIFLMSAARLPEIPGRALPQVREDCRLKLGK